MKKIRTLISLSAFILVWIPVTAYTIGISATPSTLTIKTTVNREGMARFTVSNPSGEVGLFEVYPEDFEAFITVIPSRFVLEAGEKREVLARVKRRETGALRTTIAIEAQTLGVPSFGVGGGVRLPFTIEVSVGSRLFSAAVLSGASILGILSLLCALTVLFLLRRVSLSPLKWMKRSSTLWK